MDPDLFYTPSIEGISDWYQYQNIYPKLYSSRAGLANAQANLMQAQSMQDY